MKNISAEDMKQVLYDNYYIKDKSNSVNNSLKQKAYQKYLKEHPASKMTFEQFKNMNK